MNPTQWQRVKPIFHEALERPASARAAYLAEACAGDEELLQEVNALLAAHKDTNNFLARPAVAEAAPWGFHETAELPAGRKLGGYEIQRQLGRGGMGEVYLARDSRLGRPVALKVLPASLTREPDRVRRFQQEARAASALNHPNILTIYEVGEADGVHFIATEYIEGETLRALLKRGELTLGDVLDITIQAGQALEASHRAGIVHRDIKPENLMRRADRFVKVLDFGLAKLIEVRNAEHGVVSQGKALTTPPSALNRPQLTKPGVVMGTVTYMSPEQARGHEVDARSDVFSLGAMLYEMLTGRVPFEGETTSDVIAALLAREPDPLESYISGLPAAFQIMVERALQKRREDRFASVSEMLADLRALKDELEITAKLKRSGKARQANASLLDMRVGSSQEQAGRSTNERHGRHTSKMSAWFSRFSPSWKLIAAVVSLLLLLTFGFMAWTSWQWKNQIKNTVSAVAVLPFADDTNDAQLVYLPDGLTESLINNLSRLPNLRVMASGSVRPYKDRPATPQQVGKDLNVSAVVSGRVQKTADKVLIQVELADARDGSRLWGERYERPLSDLLRTQNEIARDLTQQIRGRGAQQPATASRPPVNNEAYQLYLKGRHMSGLEASKANLDQALSFYQQALALEPTYAAAYAEIAKTYTKLSSRFLTVAEAMPKARAAAARALELDPLLAEAHFAIGIVYLVADWDFQATDRSFLRALELNPNDAFSEASYGQFLLQMKRPGEALVHARRALTLDPLLEYNGAMVSLALAHLGRFDEAQAEYRKVFELFPQSWSAFNVQAEVLARQGRLNEALAVLNKCAALQLNNKVQADLGYVQGRLGNVAEARRLVAELEQRTKKQHVPPYFIAAIYSGLNERKQALIWLRRSYEEHSDFSLWLASDWRFDPLRQDPDYLAMLKQIGLPQ